MQGSSFATTSSSSATTTPTGFGWYRLHSHCCLDSHTLRGVNSWLASTALGKGKNKVIDTAASEFVAACAKLDDGSKKPVDKIAVEWGLAVSSAAKLNEKCLIRLIAGAHLLASQ